VAGADQVGRGPILSWWAAVRADLAADRRTVRELRAVTLRRLHTASAIAVPLHVAHLVVFGLMSPETPVEQRWRSGIMLAHGGMLVLMVVANRLTVASRRSRDDPVARGLPWLMLAVLLPWGAVVAGIDQAVTTSITPYLVVSIVAALVLLLPLPRVVLGHLGGYVAFLIVMFAAQPVPSVRMSNLVNGLTAVAISLLLALLQWRAEVRGAQQAHRITLQQAQLEARNVELERLATHDSLTGLINRRQFELVVEEELAQMRRYRTPSSLLVIDADGFKPINDHLGHPAGDRVLRELAALLRSRLRESDLLARWGGDEFLVLLPRTDEAGGAVIAEQLRAAVDDHLGAGAPRVTVSIGVAALDPFDAIALEQAYHRADQALYRAKQQGRNRVVTASQVGDGPVRPG
jgi:diguanylate cyclase